MVGSYSIGIFIYNAQEYSQRLALLPANLTYVP